MATRGFRNFNPGNIRLSNGVPFRGEVLSSDKSFRQFKSIVYGIRALMKLLLTYYHTYHLCTVRAIISRFAPSIENRTDKYIDYVCEQIHVEPYTILKLHVPYVLFSLVRAICEYESKYSPSDTMLTEAYLIL